MLQGTSGGRNWRDEARFTDAVGGQSLACTSGSMSSAQAVIGNRKRELCQLADTAVIVFWNWLRGGGWAQAGSNRYGGS
jgi:hypothetical protein